MKQLSFLIYFTLGLTILTAQATGNLLFKSSFNDIIVDKTVSWNHHLSGTDSQTGYTFPDDLPGNTSEHFFNYVIGDVDHYYEYANAEIVQTLGFDGDSTSALYLEYIKDDTTFTSLSRVQYAMYGDINSSDPVQRFNRGYVKYRMKQYFNHDDILSEDWSLPFEMKDMDEDGFRVGLYVYGTTTDSPYWVAKGQYMIDGGLGEDVWQVDNHDIPVPEDEWFDLEVFWYGHHDAEQGQFKVAINNQLLFDVTNQTKDPNQPDKMFYFMPFKIYGTVGHSWITDFEYWDNPPSYSVISANNTSVQNKDSHRLTFDIFPNPAQKMIFLSNIPPHVEFQIYTILGTIVKEGNVKSQEIDLSNLPTGIYVLKITDRATKISKLNKFLKL